MHLPIKRHLIFNSNYAVDLAPAFGNLIHLCLFRPFHGAVFAALVRIRTEIGRLQKVVITNKSHAWNCQ